MNDWVKCLIFIVVYFSIHYFFKYYPNIKTYIKGMKKRKKRCRDCRWYKKNKAYNLMWCSERESWVCRPNRCYKYTRKWWKFWTAK